MDMLHPLRVRLDDSDRIDPAVECVARIEHKAYVIAGHFEEAVQLVLGFDHRSEMMVIGKAQAAAVDECRASSRGKGCRLKIEVRGATASEPAAAA